LNVRGSTREDALSLSLETQFGPLGQALSLPLTNCTFGALEVHDKTVKSTAKMRNKTTMVEIRPLIIFFRPAHGDSRVSFPSLVSFSCLMTGKEGAGEIL
jgi:hypothetical protein